MPSSASSRLGAYSWLPYVAPLAAFMALGALDNTFRAVYPVFYAVKIAVVAGVLASALRSIPEARPKGAGLGWAVVAGVALTWAWVAVDRVTPHFAFLGSRVGFDPLSGIPGSGARIAFLVARFLGLAVIVPFIEEIFFRGFLLRIVTDPDDFRRVPIGAFSTLAFAVNVLFMAVAHPEWLAAAIFSAAMCLIVARTRNLFACIVAHGVTNLALGIYVLVSHNWKYW